MISKSKLLVAAAIAGALSIGAAATAQTTPAPAAAAPSAPAATPNPTVGGAAMDATKPIAVNAAAAPNLSTLVTAVKAAGLATTLSGPGPFTVFAPTNDAFTRLAPGTVEKLLKPENKATLAKVLTYHVVPGTITFADLQEKAKANGGKVVLTTVEGEPLTLDVSATGAQLTDVNGNKSFIETADVKQSNGVVHVVNGVVLPKL
ncbi:fasciclin [Sphingomonas sp. HMWF008]|nr:fasciclin [Sphingomonas sp. HMWF008]